MEVDIPNHVYNELKKRSKKKGFKTTNNYIVYILTQVIKTIEESDKKVELTKEDEKKIKMELKKLGYIG